MNNQKSKIILIVILAVLIFVTVLISKNRSNNSIKNPASFVLNSEYEKKIDYLIENLSIEEKVGQTCQITLDAILKKDSLGVLIEPHQIDQEKLNQAIF